MSIAARGSICTSGSFALTSCPSCTSTRTIGPSTRDSDCHARPSTRRCPRRECDTAPRVPTLQPLPREQPQSPGAFDCAEERVQPASSAMKQTSKTSHAGKTGNQALHARLRKLRKLNLVQRQQPQCASCSNQHEIRTLARSVLYEPLSACADVPPPQAARVEPAPPPISTAGVFLSDCWSEHCAAVTRSLPYCYLWAVKQSGFDPSRTSLALPQRVSVQPVPPKGTKHRQSAP